jgi:hypothetical protein
MHRDKTAARILLILSVVHVAVAAPAIVRQRSLDVDEDVTPASEKRGNPGDTPQDLYPVPQMDNELPTTSGTPPSQDDPPPESGTPQLHNDQPQTSGPPPSQDDTSPASGDPQSHSGPPAGSEDPQLHDAPYPWWQHTDWRPTGEIVQGESSAQLKSGAPGASVHDDMSSGSGKSSYAGEPWPVDFPVGQGTPSWTPMDRKSSVWSETTPSSLLEPPPPPEANKFFSDALKKNLKLLAGFGAIAGVVAGVSTGLYYGLHKPSKDRSHGAYVSVFFLPSLADI